VSWVEGGGQVVTTYNTLSGLTVSQAIEILRRLPPDLPLAGYGGREEMGTLNEIVQDIAGEHHDCIPKGVCYARLQCYGSLKPPRKGV
jgi:hypothetical protein